MDDKWTPKMVSARMEEAVRTLQTLRVRGLKPRGYVSSWPDVVHDLADALGYEEVKLRLDPPTPEAITRMDEALQWLCWLEADHARLVWMMAEDVPRKLICARVGMSRDKAWRVWSAAIMTIVSMLNARRKKAQPEMSKESVFFQEFLMTGNASDAYRKAFPCDGLTGESIHSRAYRLTRKYAHCQGALTQTDGIHRKPDGG